jgi:membrane glycosyltransferase
MKDSIFRYDKKWLLKEIIKTTYNYKRPSKHKLKPIHNVFIKRLILKLLKLALTLFAWDKIHSMLIQSGLLEIEDMNISIWLNLLRININNLWK